MPIDPVKIPQNVYIEDHIVGPLTLRQLIIVGIGGGFSYALWSMISKAYGAVPIPITIAVWIPAGLSVVFAFIKFNDLSMLQMCLLTVERLNKAPVRVWSPRKGLSINIRVMQEKKDKKQQQAPKNTVIDRSTNRLQEITSILDRPMEEMDATPQTIESATDTTTATPTEPDTDGRTSLPVNPRRISVSPLVQPGTDVENPQDQVRPATSLFHDIYHPA